MYRITDNYGTRRTAWTTYAVISNRFTGRLIAVRQFTRVY